VLVCLAKLAMGPKPAKEVGEEGEAAGWAWRTIRRARDTMEIRIYRDGYGGLGQWWWRLPDAENGPYERGPIKGVQITSHTGNVDTLGAFEEPPEKQGEKRGFTAYETIGVHNCESGHL
jgi:hypothetical protein